MGVKIDFEKLVDTASRHSGKRSSVSKDETAQNNRFRELLKELDSLKKTEREKAEEAKAAEARRRKQKKITELYALIASLREKLISSGYDPTVAAELSVAKDKLLLLLFSL